MTLWNIIRDFFVQYVFGGFDSSNIGHGGVIGLFIAEGNGSYFGGVTQIGTDSLFYPIGNTFDFDSEIIGEHFISLGDWLSTTATIITLIGLFIGISMFIIKLVKWISNTIAMR